jgi:hypothetical protein
VRVFLSFHVKTEAFRYAHPPFNKLSELSNINITITATVERNKLTQYYNENCRSATNFHFLPITCMKYAVFTKIGSTDHKSDSQNVTARTVVYKT